MKRDALRLVVTGGRTFSDAGYVQRVIKSYQKLAKSESKVLVVVQGGAHGLDTLVYECCKKLGIPCFTCDAQWDYYGNPAGPIRNGWMIEFFNPTHGFVFPGDRGTADMRKKMELAGIAVETYEDFDA